MDHRIREVTTIRLKLGTRKEKHKTKYKEREDPERPLIIKNKSFGAKSFNISMLFILREV